MCRICRSFQTYKHDFLITKQVSNPKFASSSSDVSDQELQALLSQRDLTQTFAESILKQIENEEPIDSKTKLHESLNVDAMNNNRMKSPTIKCEATSTVVTQAQLKHEIKAESVVKIEKLVEYDDKLEFSNKMSAKEILETIK